MKIILKNVSKRFGSNNVIKNFNYSFERNSYAILGRNGAGKSTLLKIIGNLLLPSEGNILYDFNNKKNIIKNMFFCAPYQEIVSELTVEEFLIFHKKFRNIELNIDELLKEFNLLNFKNHKIENLSSGTIQKIKLLIAFFTDSSFILLDEPTTNLDNESKKVYSQMMMKYSNSKGIIIATNDENDIVNNNTQLIKIS